MVRKILVWIRNNVYMILIYMHFFKKKSFIKLPFKSTSMPILFKNVNLIGSNVYIGNNARIGINSDRAFIIRDGAWINNNPSLTAIINASVLSLFGAIKHANKTKNIFHHS